MPLDSGYIPPSQQFYLDWANKITAAKNLIAENGWRQGGWGKQGETLCKGKALLLAHGITDDSVEKLKVLPVTPFILGTVHEVTGQAFGSIIAFNESGNNNDNEFKTTKAIVLQVFDRCLEKLAVLALVGEHVDDAPQIEGFAELAAPLAQLELPALSAPPAVDPPDLFETGGTTFTDMMAKYARPKAFACIIALCLLAGAYRLVDLLGHA